MREELLKGLTDEQIKKASECKNAEELLSLAQAEGVELNDEQLEAVSGGGCFEPALVCPGCGAPADRIKKLSFEEDYFEKSAYHYECMDCGYKFIVLRYEKEK